MYFGIASGIFGFDHKQTLTMKDNAKAIELVMEKLDPDFISTDKEDLDGKVYVLYEGDEDKVKEEVKEAKSSAVDIASLDSLDALADDKVKDKKPASSKTTTK